jgi:hypothetical protein
MDTCRELDLKLTLFCDICCLWRYKELGKMDFPLQVENQMKYTIGEGHDVQCHLHPHWQFTDFNNGSYKFDLDKFLLGNLSPDIKVCEEMIYGLLKEGSEYLQNLLRPINPNYECIAFRAGGYGIQPNTRIIIEALIRAGYAIDSSVIPGLVWKTNVNQIDFSDYPNDANYFLSGHPDLFELNNKRKGIFEIPIPSVKKNKLWNILLMIMLLKRKLFQKDQNRIVKGFSIQKQNEEGPFTDFRVNEKLIMIFNFMSKNQKYLLEVGDDPYLLRDITKKYINKYNDGDDIFFQ